MGMNQPTNLLILGVKIEIGVLTMIDSNRNYSTNSYHQSRNRSLTEVLSEMLEY